MKVLFMGTPDFAVPVLEGLIENYNVIGVVSQPDKKVGRHHELKNTPIKEVALKHSILVLQPLKIKEEYQDILSLDPDLIVTCAYGQIIPKEILDYPKYGCINVHASLLPKYRGGAPIHRAIINGDKKTGVTIMYMDVGMDDGDIISQREIPILDTDNLETIQDKLSILGKELLLDTLPSILDGTNQRMSQNKEEVSFAYNITREEEHIDFSKSNWEIFHLIRGLSTVPGANATIFEHEMKIYDSIPLDKNYPNKKNGEIVDIDKRGIIVSCGEGSLLLLSIKPFGKGIMDASSYVNGIGKDKLIGQVFI